MLKNYFVWLAFVVSVIVGALAFCVVLSVFFESDWDIYRYLGLSPVKYVLLSFPYVWIVLLFLFLGLAFYNYKHTKKGYRCRTCVFFGLSVVASLVLGSFFHFYLGLGEKMDRYFSQKVPVYERAGCHCCRKKALWSQPEKGLLGGRIIEIRQGEGFDLEDFKGLVWQVEKDEQTFVRKPVLIIENEEVKLLGEEKAEKHFWAREIRPW